MPSTSLAEVATMMSSSSSPPARSSPVRFSLKVKIAEKEKKTVLLLGSVAFALVAVLISIWVDSLRINKTLIYTHEDDALSASIPPPSLHSRAEVSVLAGGALVAQSPLLEWTLTTLLKPALTEAALALAIHSLGIPALIAASRWLAPYSHAGWTMKHRFVGILKYWRRLQQKSSSLQGRRAVALWARKTMSQSTTSTSTAAAAVKNPKTAVRFWDSTKRAVKHLYRKRARYSVASELTNLIPPEPKED